MDLYVLKNCLNNKPLLLSLSHLNLKINTNDITKLTKTNQPKQQTHHLLEMTAEPQSEDDCVAPEPQVQTLDLSCQCLYYILLISYKIFGQKHAVDVP